MKGKKAVKGLSTLVIEEQEAVMQMTVMTGDYAKKIHNLRRSTTTPIG